MQPFYDIVQSMTSNPKPRVSHLMARAGKTADYITARKKQFEDKVAYKGPKYDPNNGPRA